MTAAWRQRGGCHLCHRARGWRVGPWAMPPGDGARPPPGARPHPPRGYQAPGSSRGQEMPKSCSGLGEERGEGARLCAPGGDSGALAPFQHGDAAWYPAGSGPGGFSSWRSLPGATMLGAEPFLVSLFFSPPRQILAPQVTASMGRQHKHRLWTKHEDGSMGMRGLRVRRGLGDPPPPALPWPRALLGLQRGQNRAMPTKPRSPAWQGAELSVGLSNAWCSSFRQVLLRNGHR